MSNVLTNDLPKRLRTVSDMINMGEKISWGQETSLMDEAATALEAIKQREERLTHALRMLASDDLSPKQRRRILAEIENRSEYSDKEK